MQGHSEVAAHWALHRLISRSLLILASAVPDGVMMYPGGWHNYRNIAVHPSDKLFERDVLALNSACSNPAEREAIAMDVRATSREYEDGTNVPRGTPFCLQLSVTEDWYRPSESKCRARWRERWTRLLTRFDQVVDECRPVSCVLMETRTPAYPKVTTSWDDILAGQELIRGGGGLRCDLAQLFTRDGAPLFGIFPIHDATGKPMVNSAGEAFAFRLGLSRQFFFYSKCNDPRETRDLPGPHFWELTRDAASLLYELPPHLAVSVWRNWRFGFSRRDHAEEYLWFDALFELSWQRKAGDVLHTKRLAWSGNTSIQLDGQGLFPRLPDMLPFGGLTSIPADSGYPVEWQSTLSDLARASVMAIDELLERAGDSQANGAVNVKVDDNCLPPTEQGLCKESDDRRESLVEKTADQGNCLAPVDFVIVTPLAEERDAVLARLPGQRKLPPSEHDIRTYYAAEVPVLFPDSTVAQYSVIVLPLARMGNTDATSATSDAIRRWQPRYVLLVGIAGGVQKAGVNLGDVLLADQVADYERQKVTPDGSSIRWQVHRVDQRLLIAAQNFRADKWQETSARRPNRRPPEVHFGPICTGDKVIADMSLTEQFREVWAKLIGVEMEAGGVANAASQAVRAPGFFMVRGVSDLADPRKESRTIRRWRKYACEIAAAWTIEFLKSGPVPPASP
jgi:nucleoside phosphorylase